MKIMLRQLTAVFILSLLSTLTAQSQSGTTGQQLTQSVTAGGGGTSSSGSTQVEGTAGQSVTATSTGGTFTLSGGFWPGAEALTTSTLSVTDVTGTYGGAVTLSATLSANGANPGNKLIAFSLNGAALGNATTDANGLATLTGVSLSGINAGTYASAISAQFIGDVSLVASTASGQLIVQKATPLLQVGGGIVTYNGQPHPATASATGVSNETLSPVTVLYNGSGSLPVNAGTYVVTASFAGNQNYNAATDNQQSIIITQATQAITFGTLTNQTYGDADFTVGATVSSGLAVSFTAAGQCTVTGNTVHLTGAGSCTITASQGGDSNYDAATAVNQSFSINKATPVITWNNPANITYGTPLSSTQLNATASTPGTLSYNPPSGAVLDVGPHQLSVNFTPADTTNYTTASKSVSITIDQTTAPALNFDSATYTVNEGDGHVTITINRTGNGAGAASVDYTTSDTAGQQDCNLANGIASSRCDYTTTVGTLRFAPGETSKTIFIPLVDDSFAEGPESFEITLSNALGENLGAVSSASITIADNETVAGSNPISTALFFVRQQYIDFLGREPDSVGFAAWQNILNTCAAGDTSCDRINVSSGFFRSPEFQRRGYFIFRFYAAALGRNPNYAEFMPDLAKVSGFLTDTQLEVNKVAYVSEFMARPEYVNHYGSLSDAAYVDTLLQAAGLPNHPQRGPWIDVLNNGTATRAEVLRAFIESKEVYDRFYNQAFVVMQYFGYLRRDPDAMYTQWIETLNQTGDYRMLINGFINSNEYVLRFGP